MASPEVPPDEVTSSGVHTPGGESPPHSRRPWRWRRGHGPSSSTSARSTFVDTCSLRVIVAAHERLGLAWCCTGGPPDRRRWPVGAWSSGRSHCRPGPGDKRRHGHSDEVPGGCERHDCVSRARPWRRRPPKPVRMAPSDSHAQLSRRENAKTESETGHLEKSQWPSKLVLVTLSRLPWRGPERIRGREDATPVTSDLERSTAFFSTAGIRTDLQRRILRAGRRERCFVGGGVGITSRGDGRWSVA